MRGTPNNAFRRGGLTKAGTGIYNFMRFIHYQEIRSFLEENKLDPGGYDMVAIMEKWSGLKKGLLAGSLGIAALAPFATGYKEPASQKADIPFNSPGAIKMWEEKKDKGLYYSLPEALKLIKMAKEGDEWAMREFPWPEGHPFHKKGRPFHKNTAPHPAGLIDSYYSPAGSQSAQ